MASCIDVSAWRRQGCRGGFSIYSPFGGVLCTIADASSLSLLFSHTQSEVWAGILSVLMILVRPLRWRDIDRLQRVLSTISSTNELLRIHLRLRSSPSLMSPSPPLRSRGRSVCCMGGKSYDTGRSGGRTSFIANVLRKDPSPCTKEGGGERRF